MSNSYPELCQWRGDKEDGPLPEFPAKCPVCGAAVVKVTKEWTRESATYACGGQYKPKPQIQTHHNIWWGVCPAKKGD